VESGADVTRLRGEHGVAVPRVVEQRHLEALDRGGQVAGKMLLLIAVEDPDEDVLRVVDEAAAAVEDSNRESGGFTHAQALLSKTRQFGTKRLTGPPTSGR